MLKYENEMVNQGISPPGTLVCLSVGFKMQAYHSTQIGYSNHGTMNYQNFSKVVWRLGKTTILLLNQGQEIQLNNWTQENWLALCMKKFPIPRGCQMLTQP